MRQGSSPGRGEERQGGRPGEGTVSESPSRRCRVRAVFFDLYGTLATFDPPREVIQANAAAQFGLDLTPAGVDRGYHLADQFMSRQNAVAPVRHMSPAEQAEFFAKFEQLVLEGAGHVVDLDTAAAVWKKVRTQRYDLALFEDVIPSLGRIRDSGLVTGLISNVNSSGAALADSMGLTGHIDFAITSGDAGAEKPHSAIFRAALSSAGVGPEQAVHVGDQVESDIDGAMAAGIEPILMDRFNGHPRYSDHARVTGMAELERLLASMRPA